jgi:hypothetical protein
MLVRVGYHQKDGLKVVNEHTLVSPSTYQCTKADEQRRDPASRLDPFEEYVAVWRKGRVELYQDYVRASVLQ